MISSVNIAICRDQEPAKPSNSGAGKNIGYLLSIFYQNVISPVDGDRCPSLPTCSSYSAEAFKKHGFFIGWLMTVDRLIHEGSEEAKVSPIINQDGKWKLLDPVQNNDFWWFNHDQ